MHVIKNKKEMGGLARILKRHGSIKIQKVTNSKVVEEVNWVWDPVTDSPKIRSKKTKK